MVDESSGHTAEYLEDLMKQLESHRKWVQGQRGGRPADLAQADLSGLSLPKAVLRKVRLTGACLTHADLSNADMGAAILIMADLSGSDLHGADLMGADLRGACLNGANLADANLAGTDFGVGSMATADPMIRFTGTPAPARRTELRDADLSRALMRGAKLADCDLTGAELVDADLTGADLRGAILVATDLSGATLTSAELKGAVLSGARIDDTVLAQLVELGAERRAKLVSVIWGRIFDVAVDIRAGSPTFGRWIGLTLSDENRCQLYIPEGFAHGFCVLSEQADVLYKCTDFYAPEDERGILWSDSEIGVQWPLAAPLLSEKDGKLRPLALIPPDQLPVYAAAV